MNGIWARGAATYLVGKIQENFGRVIGSSRQKARGFDRQVAGQAEMAIGDADAFLRNFLKRNAHPE